MRRTDDPDVTGNDTEESGARPYESRARSRSRSRRRRGYVLPLDDSQVYSTDSVRHSRRRRRRRAGVGGLEIFIGLTALWTVLVVGVIMLEALSGHEWFFVARTPVTVLDQGAWLLGDQALQEDGDLALAGPATEGAVAELVGGNSDGEVEMLWGRVLGVLLSVPLLYVGYRVVRRLMRLRQGRVP